MQKVSTYMCVHCSPLSYSHLALLMGHNLIKLMLCDHFSSDVVVVVKAESVHVYCNALNYPQLLPYIAHWRNLHIHCLNKEEV